jgi:hypothetical protein
MDTLTILSWWFKRNFLDKAYRIDTGRIGQVVGLLAMTILTWVSLVWFIQGKADKLALIAVLMGASGIPMILYRVKDFLGSAGTGFDVERPVSAERIKKIGFFGKNFTDGRGRLDTGRIGQVQGMIVTTIALGVAVYRITVLGQAVDTTHLEIVCGSSGFAMVMYRIKDFVQSKAIAVAAPDAGAPEQVQPIEPEERQKVGAGVRS